MSYSSEVLADSPLGYWRLGDSSGTTMADSSGNSRNGTYSGTFTLGATGLLSASADTAVTFGGGLGTVTFASWMTGLSAFTIEAWVKPSTVSGDAAIAGRLAFGNQAAFGLWRIGSTGFRFGINTNGGSGWQQLSTSGVTVSAGQTYHVVGIYNGSTREIYVNGVLSNSTTIAGSPASVSSGLTVGRWTDSGVEPFGGVIDEVAFYGTALSSTRIAAHYAAGTASPNATVNAVAATAAASATAPTLSGSANVTAPVATATAAAHAPTLVTDADAAVSVPAATATAEALPPTLSWDANLAATSATATAAALAPTVSAGATIAAPVAAATADAPAPAVDDGSGNHTVTAPIATATATAHAPVFTANYEVGTDTTNAFTGLDLAARGTVTITYPAATPTVSLGTRVDAALPYPQPVMDDGRPT